MLAITYVHNCVQYFSSNGADPLEEKCLREVRDYIIKLACTLDTEQVGQQIILSIDR